MKIYLSISKIIFFTIFFISSFSFAEIKDCYGEISKKNLFNCIKKSALKGNKGVKKNYATAFKWFQRDALQGNHKAQAYLGLMYKTGRGVLRNYKTAVKWFKKAALQGNSVAQGYLGNMYYNGHGVLKNYKTAVKWFKKAALQGNSEAQFYLGMIYKEGEGVKKNYVKSYAWFCITSKNELASTGLNDLSGSRLFLNDLEKIMTSSQISRGQELAPKLQSIILSSVK